MKEDFRKKIISDKLKNIGSNTIVKDCIGIIIIFLLINFVVALNVKIILTVPDEVNTLAIPAALTGEYWNLLKINFMNIYYGWGGAILYYPLFVIIKEPIILYRSIIMLNSLFLSIIPCIVYIILEKYFQITNRKLKLLSAFFIGLYPGTFSMSQYAWNEIWVRVITWILLLILLKTIHEVKKKKLNNLILGILIAYAYAIHGRMLILVFIIIIIYIFGKIIKKNFFNIKFLIIGFMGMFFLDSIIKKKLQQMIFGKGAPFLNTFSASIERLKLNINIDTFFSMSRAAFSYTFYIGITSLGIFFLAVTLLIKLLKKYKKKQDQDIEDLDIIVGLYAVLGVIFSIIIGALFFIEHLVKYKYYVYGRYADHFTSVIILFVIISVIKKRVNTIVIYETIGIFLIHTVITLLIENSSSIEPIPMNIASLISFTQNFIFDTPEKFHMIVLLLLILSIYILIVLDKNIHLALIIGISIYSISNINLEYYRIKESNSVYKIIEKKYNIIKEIKKFSNKKLTFNFFNDYKYHPTTYLMLLSKFDVNYEDDVIKQSIISNNEKISLISNDKESIMIDKDIYKINIQNDKSNYDLYYKGNEIKKFLDSKGVISKNNSIYELSLSKLSLTNGQRITGKNINLSPNVTIFGPYIELRPNHYKIVVMGERLDTNIAFIIAGKEENKKMTKNINYSFIRKDYNQIVIEFEINNFIKEFETAVINNSDTDITINSIKIMAE